MASHTHDIAVQHYCTAELKEARDKILRRLDKTRVILAGAERGWAPNRVAEYRGYVEGLSDAAARIASVFPVDELSVPRETVQVPRMLRGDRAIAVP